MKLNSWIDLSNLTTIERVFAYNAFNVECVFGFHEDFVNHNNFIMKESYEDFANNNPIIKKENNNKDDSVFGYAYRNKKAKMLKENEINIKDLIDYYLNQ